VTYAVDTGPWWLHGLGSWRKWNGMTKMITYTVKGGSGVRLHVREWGMSDGPELLFIHGWSQSHMCWQRQYDSDLAKRYRIVAFDLRGHGMSDKPLDATQYTASKLWADDVAAVISALGLARPMVFAWSYGGFVVCDYIRHYGQHGIHGINFIGGAVTLNQSAFGSLIGPGFYEPFSGATADDLPQNIEAMRCFLRGVTRSPLSPAMFETALGWNMVVPPSVRGALGDRELDNDDILAELKVPVQVTYGLKDTVVLPAMSEHILKVCQSARASVYEDIGHAPMIEAADRFNREVEAICATA